MQRSKQIDCFVPLVTFSWAAAACAAPLTAVMKGELLERKHFEKSTLYFIDVEGFATDVSKHHSMLFTTVFVMLSQS